MLMIKLMLIRRKDEKFYYQGITNRKKLIFITTDQFYCKIKILHNPNNKSYTYFFKLVTDDIFVDHKINISIVPLLELNKKIILRDSISCEFY